MSLITILSKETKTNQWAVLILSIIAYLALFALTLNRNQEFLWKDEEWYLRNIPLLEQYGLSRTFLIKYWGPAGPLYAVFHYVLKPITHLSLPGIRVVNIVLLSLICLLTWQTIKHLQLKRRSFVIALSLFSIPMIYVCSGMALTEVPAMFFLSLAIYLLIYCLNIKPVFFKVLLSIIGGVALSLSILGRQPYLLVSLSSLVFLYPKKNFVRNFLPVTFFVISSLILPFIVFSVWGNLQPPIEEYTGNGINLFHAFLSLGYAALIILLIAPGWLYKPQKRHIIYLVAIILIIILLNNFLLKFEFLPLAGVISKFLPISIMPYIGKSFASVIICAGLYLIFSSLLNLNNTKTNVFLLFFTVSCMLILFSSAKITHQFSSRYVAQAAPFIILMSAHFVKFNFYRVLGTIIGIVLGVMSLISFFQ
jgi:hypothetical protein